jgi:hypothetical protein
MVPIRSDRVIFEGDMGDQPPVTQEDHAADDPDLRMEYSEIVNNLRGGVATLWDAFKTYFTVIGLLFAGCGFLLSGKSPFGRASVSASLVIALAGFAITLLGGRGVQRIVAYQRAFIDRGLKLETVVRAELFKISDVTWKSAKYFGSDGLTYLVFGLFGVAWILIAGYCLGCLCGLGGCPTSSCT